MKLLHKSKEKIIIHLEDYDNTVLTVTPDGIIMKYEYGNGHKTKKFGFDDMIAMNDMICKIMSEVIEERNTWRQIGAKIIKNSVLIPPPKKSDLDKLFNECHCEKCGGTCNHQ